MFRISLVLLALWVTALLTPQTCSADCTTNAISISSATGGSQTIAVVGGYTVDANYNLSSIKLFATPSGCCGCGQGGELDLSNPQCGQFSITNLSVPAGTYDVKALLTVTDNSCNSYYYYSAVVTKVTVK